MEGPGRIGCHTPNVLVSRWSDWWRSTLDRILRAVIPVAKVADRRLRDVAGRLAVTIVGLATVRRSRSDRATLDRHIAGLPAADAPTRTVATFRLTRGAGAAAAVSQAVAASDAELVCLQFSRSEPLTADWLDRLVAAVRGPVVAAVPLTVHPTRATLRSTPHDSRVRALGLVLTTDKAGTATVVAARAGEAISAVPNGVAPVDAGPGVALVVDRARFVEAGGLADLDDDAATIDLCIRLRNRGGSIVAVPTSVVIDRGPVRSRRELTNPVTPRSQAWSELVARHGPALRRRSTGSDKLHVGMVVASPPIRAGAKWGDWALAWGLARSLTREDVTATVRDNSWVDHPRTRSDDVLLVLRGLGRVKRTPGQRHVLWVISHPDDVSPDECHEADLVLAGSRRLAEHLRTRTDTPVEILLQATDHRRFTPIPTESRYRHDVTIVANTRGVYRRCVSDSLAAGLRPAIYGRGWDDLVDRDLIAARHIPNRQLPAVYSSAGVLINDHWEEMRRWGMVSNRLFDAAACGTPIVTDEVPGLEEIFGDSVATYASPRDLAAVVEQILTDPEATRRRTDEARARVIAQHTFDHRARTLLEILEKHGLDTPPLA